jgi:hypothetical protein
MRILAVILLAGAAAAGSIVYVNEGRLWTIEPDGSGQALLPGAPDQVLLPVWSPDGSSIACVRAEPRFALGNSGDSPEVSATCHPEEPDDEGSPEFGEESGRGDSSACGLGMTQRDGLACDSTGISGLPGVIFSLVVVPFDPPGPARELGRIGLVDVQWGWEVREVAWSKDGSRVGFTAAGGEFYGDETTLVVSVAGGGVEFLSGRYYGDSFELARPMPGRVAPDGRRLVSRSVKGLDELFVVTDKDTTGRQVTHSERVRDTTVTSEWGSADIDGVWSPDYKRILFRPFTVADDFEHGPLLAVNPNGRDQQLLGDDGGLLGDYPQSWSPGCSRLVYEVDGSVFITDFRAAPQMLCAGSQPDWRP